MKWHPASELNLCPHELTGSHQVSYVYFDVSNEYKLRYGKETGWGALLRSDSSGFCAVYEGGLHERHAVGQGQLHTKSQRFSYFGGWRENVASGWGIWSDSWTVYWPEGAVAPLNEPPVPWTMKYEGGFKNGYFHGYAELTWNTGAYYKGSWKEGRRHGSGVYVTGDGNDGYYWEHDHDHHDEPHDNHHYDHHHDRDHCHDHCHDHEHCDCHCHDHEAMIPECLLKAEQQRTKDAEKKKADAEKRESDMTKKYDTEHQKYDTECRKYEREHDKYETDQHDLERKFNEEKLNRVKAETQLEDLKKRMSI